MKWVVNSVIMVAAAGLGLSVGMALRGKAHIPSGAEQHSASTGESVFAHAKLLNGGKHSAATVQTDDSPLATKLARDLSMSTGVTRWLYWLDAIQKAGTNDFRRLALMAKGNGVALRLLAARWAEVDPRHMFGAIVAGAREGSAFPANELGSVLFDEWPKRDPEAVIAALNGDDFGSRSRWRMHVAGNLIEQDVERGLRLMSEWHIENYGPRMKGVEKWAADDPRHAAQFALQYPAGYVSDLVMETIGKTWGKTDPAAALAFAATQPGALGSHLADAALKAWAGRDLNAAAEWLGATDDSTRSRMSRSFVEVWAKQDAGSALAWCEANLTGTSLAQAVGGVLKGAAAKDVSAAAGLVTGLQPSPARAEAAAAVAQKWFPEYMSEKPVPPEAVAWLKTLDPDSVKHVLDRLQWQWAMNDPKGLASFVASASAEQVPSSVYSTLARSMARKDPVDALDWASRLPDDRASVAGTEAFNEWWRTQPDAALQWIRGLPANDSRRQSYFENAVRMIAWNPQAADRLSAFSGTDRAAARTVIAGMSLADDQRSKLLSALK